MRENQIKLWLLRGKNHWNMFPFSSGKLEKEGSDLVFKDDQSNHSFSIQAEQIQKVSISGLLAWVNVSRRDGTTSRFSARNPWLNFLILPGVVLWAMPRSWMVIAGIAWVAGFLAADLCLLFVLRRKILAQFSGL